MIYDLNQPRADRRSFSVYLQEQRINSLLFCFFPTTTATGWHGKRVQGEAKVDRKGVCIESGFARTVSKEASATSAYGTAQQERGARWCQVVPSSPLPDTAVPRFAPPFPSISFGRDQEKKDMLLREIGLIKMLDHPNVVKVGRNPPLATENLLESTDGVLHYCSLGATPCSAKVHTRTRARIRWPSFVRVCVLLWGSDESQHQCGIWRGVSW